MAVHRVDSARLRELFDQALDLEAAERGAFLDARCGDAPELRAELAAMLAHDEGSFAEAIEEATEHLAASSPALPRADDILVGRYRVQREIGRGGMGVVFEAEQLEPRRRVALKCLNPGVLGAGLLERFHREGEALARLRHPGIAQVFEAFVLEGPSPLPFLALELVEGVPLDEVAARLPLTARLELVAAVCDALAHAHARGVVHRDLKPQNILVEGGPESPRPKILDFGLARFADDESREVLTRERSLIGTLAYLAPELLEHGSAAADPRSDVWSMGVVLYQVLSGRLPLPIEGLEWAAATRVLVEQEPLRLERCMPVLRGDVATIVHKALEKEPARRYADAAALRDDLRRFLAHQPIAARPASALYRAARFVRRHRVLVPGVLATLLALAAGLVVALVLGAEARDEGARANRRAEELRGLVMSLVLDLEPALSELPGATKVRELFVATGLRFAEGLAKEAGTDAAHLVAIAQAFMSLARVQAGPATNHLGDFAGGQRSLERALELNARACAARPSELMFMRQRIYLLLALSATHRPRGHREELAELAMQIQREAAELRSIDASLETRRVCAYAASNLANHFASEGRFEEACRESESLCAFLDEQLAQRENAEIRVELACELRGRAHWALRFGNMATARSDSERSVREAERAFELETARRGGTPTVRSSGCLVGTLQGHAMFLLEYGDRETAGARYAEALQCLERARSLAEPLAAADPSDRALARTRIVVRNGLARALELHGRFEEALHEVRAALEDSGRGAPEVLGLLDVQRDRLVGRQIEARLLNRLQRDAECDRVFADLVESTRALSAAHPHDAQLANTLVRALRDLADVHVARSERPDLELETLKGHWQLAAKVFAELLVLVRDLEGRAMLAPNWRHLLDEVPGWIGQLEAARARK